MKEDRDLPDPVRRNPEAFSTDYVHQHRGGYGGRLASPCGSFCVPRIWRKSLDTVMRGGDTDTSAAICGALLGAVHGRNAVSGRWADTLLNCRPAVGQPNVRHPRPECFWPVDALELAERLLKSGEAR